MMKKLHLSLLMLLIGVWAMALDTSVKNADGVEIWYELDSNTKTASVTSSSEKYTGEVVIPSTVTYEGVEYSVTEIGEDAFEYCRGLTSVTIPESVTSIGVFAFMDCSGLTSVTIPEGVTEIGGSAFSGCRGLTSVTIPEGVTEIRWFAFSGCSGLTSVTIPEGVTEIENGAFENCSGLTSVTIPKSVTEIGNHAFLGTAIYNNESNWENNVLYIDNCLIDVKTELSGEYAIKEDTRLIASSAFSICSGLTSVTIPASVTEIGEGAFEYCSGLTSVTIPEGVKSIGGSAFWACSGLTRVTIPKGVTEIGECAFYDCSGLTSVTIPKGVTEIGECAFYDCSGLTSVTIPESVTEIGYHAFSGTAIYNNESNWENNVLYIDNCLIDAKAELSGEYAIKEDTRLIAFAAFYGCSGLTSVTIPEGMTKIEEDAFDDCSGLTSIEVALGNENYIAVDGVLFNKDMTSLILYPAGKDAVSYSIPEGVTEIGKCAFEDCSGLTSVTIPKSVKSIGRYAFTDCSALTNVTIPESMTEIVDGLFCDCSSLTSVTIPKGVTSIGSDAFYKCSGLTSITSKSTTPPTVDYSTFQEVDKSIPLYVPAESVEAYKSAEGWKEFINILPIQADGNPISEVRADNISVRPIGNNIVVTGTDNYTVYSISGQSLGKVTSVERGIYIVVAEGKSYKVAIK